MRGLTFYRPFIGYTGGISVQNLLSDSLEFSQDAGGCGGDVMRRQSILILVILLGLLAACGLISAGSAAVIIHARSTRAPETTVMRQPAVPTTLGSQHPGAHATGARSSIRRHQSAGHPGQRRQHLHQPAGWPRPASTHPGRRTPITSTDSLPGPPPASGWPGW